MKWGFVAMLKPAFFVIALLLMSSTAGFAQDKAKEPERECPEHGPGYIDALIEQFKKEPSCRSAIKLFEACEFTASGDVPLGAAVTEKCEGDFLAKFNAGQKRTYARELKACDDKYRNKSGTMYLSFAAFCKTDVARKYSDAALKRRRK